MGDFIVVVSATQAILNTEHSFATEGEAKAKAAEVLAGLLADGWTADEWDCFVVWRGCNIVSVDVEAEVDEENEGPFMTEYERGWQNIHDEQMADVMRQNREDAEYARRQASVPSYMGVRGSFEPDGGVIYEL